MNPSDINDLLLKRDELVAQSEELSELVSIERVESDEIRELRQIVLETTNEELVVFATT